MSILVHHWRQLCDVVHPRDQSVFDSQPHSFNLDFPPPAYIGDVETAPVVLLDANGGYDPHVTPMEFPTNAASERFRDLLHNPRAVEPGSIAPYYGARNFASLIATGHLALVNAVAYRSPAISREPENRRIAEKLSSTRVHRRWLREDLLEQARTGQRLVIAHRTRLWKITRTEPNLPGVYFTTNPVSSDLSRDALSTIDAFLSRRNAVI